MRSADIPASATRARRLPEHQAPALWREWALAVTTGEVVGFSVPAVVGAVAYSAGARDAALLPPLVAAGAVEGAVLAFAQARVLRRHLPGFSARDWIVRTSAAAALAWTIGMTPSAIGSWAERHQRVIAAGAVVLGPVLLNAIGVAQWSVLRRHVPRAWRWIAANAVAWLAGMPWVFIAMAALPGDTPPALRGAAAAAGGLCMALTVAAVTGVALVRLLPPRAERASA